MKKRQKSIVLTILRSPSFLSSLLEPFLAQSIFNYSALIYRSSLATLPKRNPNRFLQSKSDRILRISSAHSIRISLLSIYVRNTGNLHMSLFIPTYHSYFFVFILSFNFGKNRCIFSRLII